MRATGIHVAIVEEDRGAGETMGALFVASGARVSIARNPAELNELAAHDPPDVVATDQMLDVRRRAQVVITVRTSPCAKLRRARLVRVGPASIR